MDIKRYGVEGSKGMGGQQMPFARAAQAGGWLYVSGQVPMVNGELVTGNIAVQAEQAIRNLLSVLTEAGYGPEHVVRCGVWLEDPAILPRSTRCSGSSSAKIPRPGPVSPQA